MRRVLQGRENGAGCRKWPRGMVDLPHPMVRILKFAKRNLTNSIALLAQRSVRLDRLRWSNGNLMIVVCADD